MSAGPLPPLPVPDADSEAFWEGLRQGVLLYQRCAACGHAQLYFRAMCRACWSRSLEAVPASGQGTVYSFTIVHQVGRPALDAETPFTLVLVDLDEGPRVLARLAADAGATAIGDRVRAGFRAVGGFNLLEFERGG